MFCPDEEDAQDRKKAADMQWNITPKKQNKGKQMRQNFHKKRFC